MARHITLLHLYFMQWLLCQYLYQLNNDHYHVETIAILDILWPSHAECYTSAHAGDATEFPT